MTALIRTMKLLIPGTSSWPHAEDLYDGVIGRETCGVCRNILMKRTGMDVNQALDDNSIGRVGGWRGRGCVLLNVSHVKPIGGHALFILMF